MKCKICNKSCENFEDIELNKKFYRCKKCKFIFLEKDFFISNENEKKQYDQHNNSLENEGYVNMFENFIDYFSTLLPTKCSALDFGSGPTPVLAELLKRRGFNVDIFDKYYQKEEVYIGKKYDLITSSEVFEHLDNPLESMNLLTNHLNKNGILAIMTLFHENKEEHFLKWWYRRDPTHISFFTPKSIKIMSEKCGLTFVKDDNKRIIILQKL